MTIAVLGIDLGKNSCSLVGLDAAGRVVLRRRMRREAVIAFGEKLPGCVRCGKKWLTTKVNASRGKPVAPRSAHTVARSIPTTFRNQTTKATRPPWRLLGELEVAAPSGHGVENGGGPASGRPVEEPTSLQRLPPKLLPRAKHGLHGPSETSNRPALPASAKGPEFHAVRRGQEAWVQAAFLGDLGERGPHEGLQMLRPRFGEADDAEAIEQRARKAAGIVGEAYDADPMDVDVLLQAGIGVAGCVLLLDQLEKGVPDPAVVRAGRRLVDLVHKQERVRVAVPGYGHERPARLRAPPAPLGAGDAGPGITGSVDPVHADAQCLAEAPDEAGLPRARGGASIRQPSSLMNSFPTRSPKTVSMAPDA